MEKEGLGKRERVDSEGKGNVEKHSDRKGTECAMRESERERERERESAREREQEREREGKREQESERAKKGEK